MSIRTQILLIKLNKTLLWLLSKHLFAKSLFSKLMWLQTRLLDINNQEAIQQVIILSPTSTCNKYDDKYIGNDSTTPNISQLTYHLVIGFWGIRGVMSIRLSPSNCETNNIPDYSVPTTSSNYVRWRNSPTQWERGESWIKKPCNSRYKIKVLKHFNSNNKKVCKGKDAGNDQGPKQFFTDLVVSVNLLGSQISISHQNTSSSVSETWKWLMKNFYNKTAAKKQLNKLNQVNKLKLPLIQPYISKWQCYSALISTMATII